MLTGDEVLVEMTAEVQWRIADVREYAFGTVRPAETLRTVAESVLREMASRQTLDGILTERRQAIEDECLARLRGRIKPLGLGIEVTELTLLDVTAAAGRFRLSRRGRRARRKGRTRQRGRGLLRRSAVASGRRTGRADVERCGGRFETEVR